MNIWNDDIFPAEGRYWIKVFLTIGLVIVWTLS